MRLNEFLMQSGLSKSAFARMIGTTTATVSRVGDGLVVPRRELLRRIYEATNGQVTPNDLTGLHSKVSADQEEIGEAKGGKSDEI